MEAPDINVNQTDPSRQSFAARLEHRTVEAFAEEERQGLMATFGTPDPSPQDTTNAIKCAMDMIAALEIWNTDRQSSGLVPVRVGIGLHYGKVIAGDIGNDRRLEYSVIGDTVNIASRLEQLTRKLDTALVVSNDLINSLKETGGFRNSS